MKKSNVITEIKRSLAVSIILFSIVLCIVLGAIGFSSYSKGITEKYDDYLSNVAGMNAHVSKPISVQQLKATLSDFV